MTDATGTHVDSQLPEVRQPIRRDAIERVGVVDGIDNTDDMGFADFEFEMRTVLRRAYSTCA